MALADHEASAEASNLSPAFSSSGSIGFVSTAPHEWHQIEAGRSSIAAISVVRLLPHFAQGVPLMGHLTFLFEPARKHTRHPATR
jgi:hypothetical protein